MTSDERSLRRLGAFVRTLENVKKVEVLPYHTLGVAKWQALNLPYALVGVKPPADELVALARRLLDPQDASDARLKFTQK